MGEALGRGVCVKGGRMILYTTGIRYYHKQTSHGGGAGRGTTVRRSSARRRRIKRGGGGRIEGRFRFLAE